MVSALVRQAEGQLPPLISGIAVASTSEFSWLAMEFIPAGGGEEVVARGLQLETRRARLERPALAREGRDRELDSCRGYQSERMTTAGEVTPSSSSGRPCGRVTLSGPSTRAEHAKSGITAFERYVRESSPLCFLFGDLTQLAVRLNPDNLIRHCAPDKSG